MRGLVAVLVIGMCGLVSTSPTLAQLLPPSPSPQSFSCPVNSDPKFVYDWVR
jgi:hypothetical protein